MSKSVIFVEGCSDAVFLNDIIFSLLPSGSLRFKDINKFKIGKPTKICESPIIEIFVAGGCVKIKNYNKTIAGYNNLGYHTILIQDADDPIKDTFIGGVKKRTDFLQKIKQEYSIKFETFLFPDNTNDGNLEGILLQLVIEDKYKVFYKNYFDYSKNVKVFSNNVHSTELMQDKYLIYNYSQVYHGMHLSNEKNRDYHNGYWNLKHHCLDPLKIFLVKQLNL